MGTVMNGNKWSGACVNGKVVSGLVKNGVVFFRKPISTYKRRIMVGDVLGGKTIYNDFKNDDSFFQEWLTSKDYSSFITSYQSTSNHDYFEFYIVSDESTYLSLAINYPEKGEEIYIYNYDNGNVTIVPKVTIRNDLNYDTVTSIVDNVAYRHLFIEDENIRPLEVGDVITANTRFYFTFPDDFRNELPNQWTPSIHDIVILNENSTENIRRMSISYTSSNNNDCMIIYWYKVYGEDSWGGNPNATIFDLAKKRNLSFILAGDMNQLESVGFVGTVSTINTTSPAYKYILVDTTTLGA